VHVLGVAGLLAGVLAGCTARWLGASPWQAHQVFIGCWSILGLAFGLLALSATNWSRIALRAWQEGLGLALIVVGVVGSGASGAPLEATAVPLLGAVGLAGCMAVGYGEPSRVYLAGLLLNLLGGLLASRAGIASVTGLLLLHALCLAVAALGWSLVELLFLYAERPHSLPGP